MKNANAIASISRQIGKVAEHLDMIASDAQYSEQTAGDISGVLNRLMVDELEHVQILTLKLTELIAQDTSDENSDGEGGSVFAEGDLTVEKTGEAGKEGGETA